MRCFLDTRPKLNRPIEIIGNKIKSLLGFMKRWCRVKPGLMSEQTALFRHLLIVDAILIRLNQCKEAFIWSQAKVNLSYHVRKKAVLCTIKLEVDFLKLRTRISSPYLPSVWKTREAKLCNAVQQKCRVMTQSITHLIQLYLNLNL